MTTAQVLPLTSSNIYPDILSRFTPNPVASSQINIVPMATVQPAYKPKEEETITMATVGGNAITIQAGETCNFYQRHEKVFEPIVLAKRWGPLIIYDKRWYFRLVQARNGEYQRSRALMDDFDLNMIANHMVVCFTPDILPGQDRPFRTKEGKPGRIYAFFDSYLEFFDYMQKFSDTDRAFYELIFGELPQKPHFDIDISLEDLNQAYPGENIDTVADKLIEALITGCILVLADHSVTLDIHRDVLLYSSHNLDKRSFHLVLNNKCHDGHKETKAFYDAVVIKVKDITQGKYLGFIDAKVYSPRQQFRLVGCQKQRSNRPKVFYEEFLFQGTRYTHIYNEDVSDIMMKKLTMIYESMVSFTAGCTLLPSLIPPKPINHSDLGTMPDLEDNIVDRCMIMLRNRFASMTYTITNKYGEQIIRPVPCPFSMNEIHGHIITLKRDAPSYCTTCRKVHDDENPYMFIIKGKLYFDCRRTEQWAPDAPKLFIGYLAITITEMQNGGQLPGIMAEHESEIDEGEFTFGDFDIGAPTLPPIRKPSPKSSSATISNLVSTSGQIITSPQNNNEVTIPVVTIPVSELTQNVQELTMTIAKERAQKQYHRKEPEYLFGVCSFSSVTNNMAWTTGLNSK